MGLFREILNTVNSYFNPQKLSNPEIGWQQLYGSDYVSSLQAPEVYRSFAYSCINARAEKTTSAELKLQQKQASGKYKDIKSHPFYDLIANPNIYQQSFKEIIYAICVNLDLPRGEAFLYYPKNILNMPAGLYLLPTKNVSIELNQSRTAIQRYKYTYGTETVYYLPEEIIHFKLYNPDNPFCGKGTASAARYALDVDAYQSIYAKNYFLNDAAIGVIFKIAPKLTQESFDRLNDQIKQRKLNPTNAGKHLVLDNVGEGSTIERLDNTPRESDFTRSRAQLKDEICGLFRTPKSILGFTDDVNRANADASNRSFLTNTVIPFSFNIWDKLEQFIKINYDERLFLKADYNLQEPLEVLINGYDKGVNRWIRPNEIRAQQGLPEDWDNEADSNRPPQIQEPTNKEDETAKE